jgi:putative MATE family efflux protein
MNDNTGKDLSVGSIPKKLLFFSLPMLIGNLLSTGYSIINTIWVGNILGENAVGASSVSFPVLFLLIGIANGATLATSILIAQFYGAKNFKMIEKIVNNSLVITLILGIIMSVTGIIFSGTILKFINTSDDIYPLALPYLKIMLAGFIFQYFYFLISAMLRGIGDTITPLFFLGISTVINAILDPLLIIGIGPFPKLGLNGAAIASLISVVIALIFGIVYLYRKDHLITPNIKEFGVEGKIILLIFKIGFPSIIQQSLVSIGAIFISSFVNIFGSSATNAFGAGNRVDSVAMMPALSLSMAVSTMTGQNLGAGKSERIRDIFKWGVIMGLCITAVITLIAQIFPHIILNIFGFHEETNIRIGVSYLRIVSIGYIVFTVMFISNGIINGAGDTIITMLFSILSLWVIRVPVAAILSHTYLGLNGIWISMVLSFFVITIVSLSYYFSGRWKKAYKRLHHPVPIVENSEI